MESGSPAFSEGVLSARRGRDGLAEVRRRERTSYLLPIQDSIIRRAMLVRIRHWSARAPGPIKGSGTDSHLRFLTHFSHASSFSLDRGLETMPQLVFPPGMPARRNRVRWSSHKTGRFKDAHAVGNLAASLYPLLGQGLGVKTLKGLLVRSP
jgi:hypothetical protein